MDERIRAFVASGCKDAGGGIYEASVTQAGGGVLFLADQGDADLLVAVDVAGFEGTEEQVEGKTVTLAPLTHANAEALRKLLPFTAPSPVLGKRRTIGLGDRLGIATDGHIRALAAYDAAPVFSQQSIRELTLTRRTFHDVLDCATFAVFRNGFRRPFGADGDHLKTEAEVRMAIDCGCTMITLDCSEHIHGEVEAMSPEEVAARFGECPELEERYLGKTFQAEEHRIAFSREELQRTALIYGEALDFAAKIYHEFMEGAALDFELSIDETATPTTPVQHYFVARELQERNVKVATVAPRFCGEFQKGIDYVGDTDRYAAEFAVHAAIARTFGYKVSIHSGSDKFSVFPASGRLSQGCFHVKTAGTNWLEAVQVVAEAEPGLYRELHRFALEHFQEAAKYYHVTTDLGKIPSLDTLSDSELPGLFRQDDARQLIHITYGLILTAGGTDGKPLFRDRLFALWRKHREDYASHLEKHIGKHLELLYSEIPEGYR